MNDLQMRAALNKAFGHISIERKKGTTNMVVASVEGWHGPKDGTDQQKAALSIEAPHSKQALSDLFDLVSGMAAGGMDIKDGQTVAYPDRYVTQNSNGDDVTYHSGEDRHFPKGFYLNNRPNAKMRR